MKILGVGRVTCETAAAWATSRGATPVFVELAVLYWHFAPERGVRPEVAYAQAAKETGFGRFGGTIDASFRNPCGLKVAGGGGNDDPGAHQRFPTWDVGVIAHLDHLALYAGALGYPRPGTPDPRHFDFILGSAPSVEALGGTWAPAPDYGLSLVESYVRPLLAFDPPPPPPAPVYATAAEVQDLRLSIQNLIASDVLSMQDVDELRTLVGEIQRAIHDAGNRLTQTV